MHINPSNSTDSSPHGQSTDAGRGGRRGGSRRDSGMTAMILGVFAIAWFGWGQADASGAMTVILTAGSSAAAVVAALGAISVFRAPRAESALHDPAVGRRYGIVVGLEFAIAGLGAGILGAAGAPDYIPVWVCAVVGLHFFALAAILDAAALRWLGASVTSVAVIAFVASVSTTVAPSSVTGPGAGLALLAYASVMLRSAESAPCGPSRAHT